MDAKNSPLALLAQTCSSIGVDAPNPKLVANMEKSAKHLQKSDSRDKSSPGSQSSLSNSSSESHHPKSSFKPYESSLRDRSATTPEDYRSHSASNHRIKTPKQMHLTQMQHQQQQQQNGRCDSNQSAASPRSSPAVRKSSSSSIQQQPINLEKCASPNERNHRASVTTKESSSASSRSTQESPLYSSSKLADATKESAVSYPKTSSSIPTTTSASVPPFFGAYGPAGLPYPMDLMAASALMSSPHHAMLKAATMNPYLYGNRMKLPGSNGSDSLTCRDPFCTGCPLTPHPIGKCPAGCTQCDHPNSSASSKSASSYAQQMSQAFAHAQLAALAAASQMPHYVCNWIAGDATYCGKRFSTSDELLQHLRTHTSSMPESMLNPATAGLPPTHPLFQRTYPTPPLSPLSSSRYHPYNKPSMLPPTLPPSLAGLQGMPHPSLAPYFAPYALYGPRLGNSPGMHP